MSKERSDAVLRQLMRKGKDDALIIFELRDACQRWLDSLNDLDLALSLNPDEDDILNGFVDDAYESLLPALIKRAGSVEGLVWHVDPSLMVEAAARWNNTMFHSYPEEISIHEMWKGSMADKVSVTIDGHEIKINYVDVDPQGNKLASQLSRMSVFVPRDYLPPIEDESETEDE